MQLNAVLLAGSLIDLDGTAIIQLVIFFIALVLLRSLVFKPMVRLFEAREEAIEGAREEAKALTKDANNKAATFEEEMKKVRLSAGEDRDKLRQEGQRLERAILDRVREETAKTQAAAEAKIRSEGARIRAELKGSIPGLAEQISGRLLGREVS